MDPVDPKANQKDFDDRQDKDIDNDGDVDKTDKYLHRRRKAVTKAVKGEGKKDKIDTEPRLDGKSGVNESELVTTRRADVGVEKVRTPDGKMIFKRKPKKEIKVEADGVADQAVDKHNCATHVYHEEFGDGQPIYSMHAEPDEFGLIEWYDVMFEHGIEKKVPTSEMKVTKEMSHGNHKKKK